MKRFAALALVSTAVLFHASSASADDAGDKVSRVKFSTDKATIEIEKMSCHLEGAAFVNGRSHAIDVRLDDQRCSTLTPADDAFPVRVTLEARDDGRNEVTVEADVPEGEHAAEEVNATVKDIARELRRRIEATQRARVQTPQPTFHPEPAPEETKPQKASPGLYAFGITSVAIGGAGMAIGAVVGIGSLFVTAGCGLAHSFGGGAGCSANGGFIATGALLGGGALLMLTGAIEMSIGGRKVDRVSAYVGPNGGGLRVKF